MTKTDTLTNETLRAQPSGSHFIGGTYVEDTTGEEILSLYPATQEVIARVHSATPSIVDKAVSAARAGFAIWRSTAPSERSRVLRKAADLMRERNRELSELETLDTGKPLQETLVADAASGAEALEYFASVAATTNGEHIDLGGSYAMTKREPLGICLGLGAWNYPIQIAAWKAAPALAAGNAMIFKPSEVTCLSALKLAEIFREAGLPDGVFNVVQANRDAAATLVAHPEIAKVSLTGSVPTGKKVAEKASSQLKHMSLELGGKSPIIVFEDSDIDNAVAAAMNGNFYSTGQICSNGTRVFVHSSIKAEFLKRLKERTEKIIIGDPMNEDTQLGPLVSKPQLDKVMDYISVGQSEGAVLFTGGNRPQVDGLGEGLFVAPTVFTEVKDDMRIACEEIFGPVMCVLDFDGEADVIRRANDTEFGLAAAVFTKDIQRAYRVIDQLEAGTCWINNYNLTPVEMPFGGFKNSGIGRENGQWALDQYSQVKSIYVEMGDVEAGW
ncbi:NAD/NADP-dependent betaine aldehyde dehydrogenase [Pseudovibrio axinellae]|uniref:Betaine-aldehyde dehydrogenase n=1 Tax=Pseudovibrio axinellae TaxID=989403 RepID=A0A165Z5C8_9HYPH|nr:betaine-aldehyde dehydrogenase [Pseudovibrio axinellae]KZL19524.1 NAD/NADP-dependent betaine aldehyde dehydrogenase [Pseudovibrio axinellae]SEQ30402.1 betaine aldehyde dehydrogenase [Pseudovibrio axinellae]